MGIKFCFMIWNSAAHSTHLEFNFIFWYKRNLPFQLWYGGRAEDSGFIMAYSPVAQHIMLHVFSTKNLMGGSVYGKNSWCFIRWHNIKFLKGVVWGFLISPWSFRHFCQWSKAWSTFRKICILYLFLTLSENSHKTSSKSLIAKGLNRVGGRTVCNSLAKLAKNPL